MNSHTLSRAHGFDPGKLAMVGPALRSFVECGLLAGIVTLTSRGGETIQSEVIGWGDIETNTPMKPDMLFRIASMSKPITSVAALMLLEQGRITLEDPISRWVPELADLRVLRNASGPLDDTVPAKRAITIEDLLTHRSGIAYAFFSEGPLKAAYEATLGDPAMNHMSPDEWLAAMGTLPLAYQPGERFHYGHSTDVLGFLIGRVEGKPFREVLGDRIFAPLGMTDTDFWLPSEKRGRLASMYKYDESVGGLARVEIGMPDEPPAYTPGGGGLISSAADYHRFARMLLGSGELDGVRLLQPETVRLMRTNRLTDAQRQVPFAGMDLWRKSGFGLGLSTAEDPVDNPYFCGAPGSVTWPGIYGTWWQADPVNDLVMIYLVQHQVPVSANAGATIATGVGASGRRALPVYQHGIYAALQTGGSAQVRKPLVGNASSQAPSLSEGYANSGSDQIHFVEQGSGSPVLLLHGAFGSGANFIQRELGASLARRYRVIAPDSLAHGGSDAPCDRNRYGARQRALHLVAVLDALGIERAHVVGYSMGGWMASALATYHPERVASLAIGGWDVVSGMYTPAAVWGLPEITYDILKAMVQRDRPELLEWVRPDIEPGLAAAIDGMNELTGLAEGVTRCKAPVAIWMGEADLYYAPSVQFTEANCLPLIVLPGDHVSMLEEHGAEAARRVADFIGQVESALDARPGVAVQVRRPHRP